MGFKIVAIDEELENEIKNMKNKIKELFNLSISKVQASRIIAYKNKISNLQLTSKKLIEILGGKI